MRAKMLQACPTLCAPVDCSPPGSSVRGVLQEEYCGVLPRPPLQGIFPTQGLNPHLLMSPALAHGFFITSATWEALGKREPNNTPVFQPRRQRSPD